MGTLAAPQERPTRTLAKTHRHRIHQSGFLQRTSHHPTDKRCRHEVEHNSADHLEYTKAVTQPGGDAGPQRTTQGPGKNHRGNHEKRGPRRKRQRYARRRNGAKHQLALGADVEHARAKRHRYRKAHEQEWRGTHHRCGPQGIARPHRAIPERE